MTRGALLGLALLIAACGGPRRPGAVPGQTYFWHLLTSEIEIGSCSDAPSFRSGLVPLMIEPNSYFTYKVGSDGKSANRVKCSTLDSTSCVSVTPAVTYTIAGSELSYTSVTKLPLGTAGCQQADTSTTLMTDLGETAKLDLTHVLSLTDNATACAAAEKDVKAQSPNMLGIEGCVVNFKIGLALK